MKLPLNDREKAVFRSMADTTEGVVLVGYFRRLMQALTDTRKLEGADLNIEVAAANKASDIIEENLIEPLSPKQRHRGEHERYD